MIIGVTGKSGSGKTTITDLINKNNEYEIIHVDDITHTILDFNVVKEELRLIYGNKIFSNDNSVDRKKLGNILFNDTNEMNKYNKFIYSFIEKYIDNIISSTSKNIIIDWMQLPLSKYFNLSSFNILVDAPLELRKERVGKRDNISESYFESRERNSLNYDNYNFDFVFINDDNNIGEKIKYLNKKIERES